MHDGVADGSGDEHGNAAAAQTSPSACLPAGAWSKNAGQALIPGVIPGSMRVGRRYAFLAGSPGVQNHRSDGRGREQRNTYRGEMRAASRTTIRKALG